MVTTLPYGGAKLVVSPGTAQSTAPGTYGVKVYRVDSSLYPYVQVFFRTFNEAKQPLVNLNQAIVNGVVNIVN